MSMSKDPDPEPNIKSFFKSGSRRTVRYLAYDPHPDSLRKGNLKFEGKEVFLNFFLLHN
jgi:hypothetical protein